MPFFFHIQLRYKMIYKSSKKKKRLSAKYFLFYSFLFVFPQQTFIKCLQSFFHASLFFGLESFSQPNKQRLRTLLVSNKNSNVKGMHSWVYPYTRQLESPRYQEILVLLCLSTFRRLHHKIKKNKNKK
jgi:hypothetical protein